MQRLAIIDDDLLRAMGLDDLLPAPLSAWRPLLRDGAAFFLNRLPAQRMAPILADQRALPADAGPDRRLAALFSHCPTLHKLGQVLARHRSLPAALRRQLQTLESMPATAALRDVSARIREELGGLGGRGRPPLTLADAALAEGSVAVVVPFTYRQGGRLRHGVFKVLKPGVEARVGEELAILGELESFLERRSQALGLPALDYRDTLRTVQRLLLKEVRLDNEQTNLRAAAAFYADRPEILIPALLPWCTPRLTAMQRVFGGKVTDARLSRQERRDLADTLVVALLGEPMWSASERTLFHADLHAGNLLLATDGRLAIIDWSLSAALSKSQREALVAIALGGLTLDAPRVCAALASLGTLAPGDAALAAAVDRALDRLVFAGGLPGFSWLLALLDDVALHAATGFPEDFALLRKAWLSLAGVLGDLAGEASPDGPLLALGLRRFWAELPARLQASPDAAGFSTHVSNAELWRIGLSPWLVAARYWLRRSRRQGGGGGLWAPYGPAPALPAQRSFR